MDRERENAERSQRARNREAARVEAERGMDIKTVFSNGLR